MKKLIPVMLGLALTFGAVSMYANNGPQTKTKTTKAKTTKAPKKSTKKS